ncbi:MAG: restriction endonuclease subunit S [Bacteroidetes bacterium]|nr:restriction endonuclease subunit S [Bacteroidota bacterium]
MKSHYKPLGKYIQLVVGRNNELGDLPLMGLSISKKFIPSIANTIGTDMSTYRTIYKNQFAYGPVTSRNGDKFTIALFNDYDKALISQAYIPFEVKDSNELEPEYLMMWFRRPEFDRYARFKSHGSAREIFDWEEMCNTLLPVPHPDKQREIVKEYNTIQNRIALNQQLIQKLEETAQAIYRQWFVEGIDLQNLPEGWTIGDLSMISKKIFSGGTPSTEVDEYWNGDYYWFSSGETGYKYILSTEKKITKEGIKNSTTKKTQRLSTVIATAGQGKTRGQSALIFNDVYINQSVISVEPISTEYSYFIFLNINSRYEELRNDSDAQSIRGSINSNDIKGLSTIVPLNDIMLKFHKTVSPFFEIIENKMKQNQMLKELKDLLLSKLATIEN